MISDRITARVFWMATERLMRGQTITLRLATQDVPCRVEKITNRMDSGSMDIFEPEADELADTEVAQVTFIGEGEIQYDSFTEIPEMGRLVLMRGNDIVGGGTIS